MSKQNSFTIKYFDVKDKGIDYYEKAEYNFLRSDGQQRFSAETFPPDNDRVIRQEDWENVCKEITIKIFMELINMPISRMIDLEIKAHSCDCMIRYQSDGIRIEEGYRKDIGEDDEQ